MEHSSESQVKKSDLMFQTKVLAGKFDFNDHSNANTINISLLSQ